MTKTQKQKEVLRRFFTFVDEVFPNYELDDCGDGGRITFFPINGTSDDAIEFQRSRLDLCVLNCASDQSKQDCKIMKGMLKVIQILLEVEAL
jgi:hypothetical protein